MGFVAISAEELNDYYSEMIRYNSLAHRLSNLDGDKFDEFIKNDDRSPKKSVKQVDHLSQMKSSQGV